MASLCATCSPPTPSGEAMDSTLNESVVMFPSRDPSFLSKRLEGIEERLSAHEAMSLQLAAGLEAAKKELALKKQLIEEGASMARPCDVVEAKIEICDNEVIAHETPPEAAEAETPPKIEETRVATYSEAKQILAESQEYSLSESAWDAAFLAYSPVAGSLGSVFVSVAIVMNIICQLVFCIIAWTSLGDPQNGDFHLNVAEESLAWRLSEAHSPDRMDKASWQSLATRVCELDKSLVFGTGQVGLLAQLRSYLMGFGGDNLAFLNFIGHEGTILAGACLVLWFFNAFRELFSCVDVLNALCMIPFSGMRSRLRINADNMFVIEALGWPRRICLLLVTSIRMILCVLLLISGGKWLSVTSNHVDLLLNAAALAFVFDLDECIFATLAPPMIKRGISRTSPLKIKHEASIQGLGFMGPIALILACVYIWLFFTTEVLPMAVRMREVNHTMCENETRFVVELGTGLGYAVAVTTKPFQIGANIDTLVKSATQEIFSTNITVDDLALLVGRPAEQQAMIAVVVGTEAEFNTELRKTSENFATTTCIDELHKASMGDDDSLVMAYLQALRFQTELFNATNCSGFRQFCRDRSSVGTWVRSFCSRTCKCHTHGGYLTDRSGCSIPCNFLLKVELSSFVPSEVAEEQLSSCMDKPSHWFATSEAKLMLEDLEEVLGVELPKENISMYGCETMAAISASEYFGPAEVLWVPDALCGRSQGSNIAVGDIKYQTARFLCPVTCGCSLDFSEQCPRSCKKGAFATTADACSQGLCPSGTIASVQGGPDMFCWSIDRFMKTGDPRYVPGGPEKTTHTMCETIAEEYSTRCCCPGSWSCDDCSDYERAECASYAPCFDDDLCGWCNASEACNGNTDCQDCEDAGICSKCFKDKQTDNRRLNLSSLNHQVIEAAPKSV